MRCKNCGLYTERHDLKDALKCLEELLKIRRTLPLKDAHRFLEELSK